MATPAVQNKPFDPEGLEQIRSAGLNLAMAAAPMVGDDPHLAMVALVLAAGHLAAIMKFPYADLVKMIGDHYEYVLLREMEAVLPHTDIMVPKPEGRF